MPVKLRLRRQGRKKAAHFAIVAADSRYPRDGRYIEKLGFYNPVTEPAQVYVDHDRAIKWLQNGAQPTLTVRALLRHAGVTLKYALIKQGKSSEEMERIFSRWWEEKKTKKKKKVIQIDIHGKALEEVPVKEKIKPAPIAMAHVAVDEVAPETEEVVAQEEQVTEVEVEVQADAPEAPSVDTPSDEPAE